MSGRAVVTFDALMAAALGAGLLWVFAGLRAAERDARDYAAVAFRPHHQYTQMVAHCAQQSERRPKRAFCHTALLWIVDGRWQEVCAEAFTPYHLMPARWFLIRSECGLWKGSRKSASFPVIHLLEKI